MSDVPLTLLPLPLSLCDALAADAATLPIANAEQVRELVREVAAGQAALYRRTGAQPPWIGYLAVTDERRAVGMCSFKDGPREGAVEIAYFTFPGGEGQGIGMALARGLLAIAAASMEVATVVAHTLPECSASTTILGRLGFALIGPTEDPEDGTVWRWEQSVADATGSSRGGRAAAASV